LDKTRALKLFNEKAERLYNSRFVNFLKEKKKLSFQISVKKGEKVETTRSLPDQDAVDAFVLTFRFFIQNNERCSFGNLNEVYQKLPFSEELKNKYFDTRKKINQYLDTKTSINIYGETPTRRKLLDIFIYGGLAHVNPKKEKIYGKWKQSPFCIILDYLLRVILYVADINEEAIIELDNKNC
jgi:hypothetical protein